MPLLFPLAEKISTALPPGAGAGIVFWIMAALTLAGALRVVTAKNPVHSALALILTLAAVSGLYVLLEAPFVWAVQLLVYTGGVTVLYLFVIFFSDLRSLARQRWAHKGWLWSLPGLAVLLALLVHALAGAGALEKPVKAATATGTPELIGKLLFGDLVIPFELSSVLLVVALIGAIALARESKTGEETPGREAGS